MGHITIAIEALAQGLHHQLLQVSTEHLQAIAIGEHHHVALALASPRAVPSCGHQSCRVAAHIMHTSGFVHLRSTCQEAADVRSDQSSRNQANSTGDAGASADPVEHVETLQPLFSNGLLVELAVSHGDCHSLSRPLTSDCFQAMTCLLHPEMGLRCTTRLAHRYNQGGA